jgi:hypothetical protein
MKHRVRRFSILQTSKTSAMLYGLFFLLFSTLGITATLLGPKKSPGIHVFMVLSVFYMIVMS